MTYHVLVAEPSNDLWVSIAKGVRRYRPEAAILRVKDGEQALRFLFERGLFMDAPETPQLIVLDAQMPLVPLNVLIARIRQSPRTRSIPLVIVWRTAHDGLEISGESQQWLYREPGVVAITGTRKLESELADAVFRATDISRRIDHRPGDRDTPARS